MKKKRFMKLCMSRGISRNVASRMSGLVGRKQSYCEVLEAVKFYPELMVELMCDEAQVEWDRAEIRHETRLKQEGRYVPECVRIVKRKLNELYGM